MSNAQLYLWLKALHVAAALTFAGGVLASAVFLAAITVNAAGVEDVVHGMRRWDQFVTTPAMLSVWALGLTLAMSGDWFGDRWLQAKLVFVVVLSGVHGVQSGRLRRLAGGVTVQPLGTAPLVVGCVAVIALLAVAKPF